MASAADIESSLEMREILQLEVQTLTKDEAALDEEIAALKSKNKEMDEKIEEQKSQLISGTRRLKNLNAQRLQAEYASLDSNDQMDAIVKSFDAKALVYGHLEIAVLQLEKEIEWKKEDVAKWKAIRETKIRAEEQRLGPKLEEKNRLKEELAEAKTQVSELKEKEEERKKLASSRNAEIEHLNREIRMLENRNEAYRQRMRVALQDLNARIAIKRQKVSRGTVGRNSQREVRWTPVKRSKLDLSERD